MFYLHTYGALGARWMLSGRGQTYHNNFTAVFLSSFKDSEDVYMCRLCVFLCQRFCTEYLNTKRHKNIVLLHAMQRTQINIFSLK